MKTLITSIAALSLVAFNNAADAGGYISVGTGNVRIAIGDAGYGNGGYGDRNFNGRGYGDHDFNGRDNRLVQTGCQQGRQQPQWQPGYGRQDLGYGGQRGWAPPQPAVIDSDYGRQFGGQFGQRQPHLDWHDTTHVDYEPGRWVQRGCQRVWIPGRPVRHQDGHFDLHHDHH
ncbi:MAG: hypothetical protein R3B90_10360 [Planctomycetaceae bacterium]